MTASSNPRFDLHARITQTIVAAIEAGAKGDEFEMPWHRPGTAFDVPRNVLTGKPYHGINVLSLWIDADEKKFTRQRWATFKQWEQMNCHVRKGEKGSLIVKYGTWTPNAATPKGSPGNAAANADNDGGDSAERLYARPAWVFNAAQVDGAETEADSPRPDLTTRLEAVDRFIAATGASIGHGGTRAFYRRPPADLIMMPPRNLFTGTSTSTPTESYYATQLHELSHWTGAEHRLNRSFGKRFGDHDYALEELCAELSAAYLCAELSISNAPRLDHARYLENWLAALKADTRAIFAAASAASRASQFLIALQPAASADDAAAIKAA